MVGNVDIAMLWEGAQVLGGIEDEQSCYPTLSVFVTNSLRVLSDFIQDVTSWGLRFFVEVV